MHSKKRNGVGLGKSKKAAGPRVRSGVAVPPPIVNLSSRDAEEVPVQNKTNPLIGSGDKTKNAWAGAAEQAQQKQSQRVVSRDGSIMPKPGEAQLDGGVKRDGGTSSMNTSGVTQNRQSAFPKSAFGRSKGMSREWDGRERGKPRGGGEGSGHQPSYSRRGLASSSQPSVPASSISAAAAAAAVAAAASTMPAVMRSQIREQSDAPKASLSAFSGGSKTSAPKTYQPPHTLAKKPAPSVDETDGKKEAPVANDVNLTTIKSSSALAPKKSSLLSLAAAVSTSSATSSSNPQSSGLTSGPASARASGSAGKWRESRDTPQPHYNSYTQRRSASGSDRFPQPSQQQQVQQRTNDRRNLGSSPGASSGSHMHEIVRDLKSELEKEKESNRAARKDAKSLKQANYELQQKINAQEKELSLLKRELHEVKSIQRMSTQDTTMPVLPHHLVAEPSRQRGGESRLLQSLYASSPPEPAGDAPPPSGGSSRRETSVRCVEDFTDMLLGEVLESYSTDHIWREARRLNNASIMSIDYQDTIARPQNNFQDAIDNSDAPFVPKLRRKPNCIEVLNHQELMAKPWLSPYRTELIQVQYQPWQLSRPHVLREIQDMNERPVFFLNQPFQVDELVSKFHTNSIRELAIDLEHHSLRSYHGFLCLMQISTRSEDFLIDVLALRSYLHKLLPVFTNGNIVKVLHGADSDIIWLQRDLGLYIVNMFDTGQAARMLRYPSYSYSFLLTRFAGIQPDKKHQMSDWRIRPLPLDMLNYARQDTHYLLDIYDRLRCELCDQDEKLVRSVLKKSAQLCMKTYIREPLDKEKISALLLKLARQYQVRLCCGAQRRVFSTLAIWRDRVARIRDESVQYVLEDKLLITLAKTCPTNLETLQQDISRANSPMPPLVFSLRRDFFWQIASVLDPKGSQDLKNTSKLHNPANPIGFGWFERK